MKHLKVSIDEPYLQGKMVFPENPEITVHLGTMVVRVLLGIQAQKVLKVSKVLRAIKVTSENQERTERASQENR